MPATPERIGFIQEQFRIVKSVSAQAIARYGNKARKSGVVETYFENKSDAQAMCNERIALLGGEPRRFRQTVSGTAPALSLSYSQVIPLANVIDDQRQADHDAIVSEIVIDFGNDEATLETWG